MPTNPSPVRIFVQEMRQCHALLLLSALLLAAMLAAADTHTNRGSHEFLRSSHGFLRRLSASGDGSGSGSNNGVSADAPLIKAMIKAISDASQQIKLEPIPSPPPIDASNDARPSVQSGYRMAVAFCDRFARSFAKEVVASDLGGPFSKVVFFPPRRPKGGFAVWLLQGDSVLYAISSDDDDHHHHKFQHQDKKKRKSGSRFTMEMIADDDHHHSHQSAEGGDSDVDEMSPFLKEFGEAIDFAAQEITKLLTNPPKDGIDGWLRDAECLENDTLLPLFTRLSRYTWSEMDESPMQMAREYILPDAEVMLCLDDAGNYVFQTWTLSVPLDCGVMEGNDENSCLIVPNYLLNRLPPDRPTMPSIRLLHNTIRSALSKHDCNPSTCWTAEDNRKDEERLSEQVTLVSSSLNQFGFFGSLGYNHFCNFLASMLQVGDLSTLRLINKSFCAALSGLGLKQALGAQSATSLAIALFPRHLPWAARAGFAGAVLAGRGPFCSLSGPERTELALALARLAGHSAHAWYVRAVLSHLLRGLPAPGGLERLRSCSWLAGECSWSSLVNQLMSLSARMTGNGQVFREHLELYAAKHASHLLPLPLQDTGQSVNAWLGSLRTLDDHY